VTARPAFVGIDTGGTFTDFVAVGPDGITTHKILSTPHDPADAVLRGLAELLGERPAAVVTYGSTVATNALLERKGAHVALLTTAGFEDVIEIGRQNRPDLYALEPERPLPLVARADRIGVQERLLHDGSVHTPLRPAELRRVVQQLRRRRPQAVAVCLLHAHVDGGHERLLGAALAAAGIPFTLSHQLVGEHREYERTSTTVINAYVAPVMQRHLARLECGVPTRDLRVMQSNGGAIAAELAGREAVRTALSGPAGGVIGAWQAARTLGIPRIITFDMGGTSTDVSLLDGGPGFHTAWEIGGLPIKVPAIDIHTVGAGGGSIARVDAGGALKVGPESAGADPGPACYGRGDAPTVTDANVVTGRLVADAFLGGRMGLDLARATRALADLGQRLGIGPEQAAAGVQRIVTASMERAVRRISVERGHDPRDYALVAFGGAAGQHACDLAAGLGIRHVVVPVNPGLLSAWGCLGADTQRDWVVSVNQAGARMADLRRLAARLLAQARREPGLRAATCTTTADVRYHGQSHEIRLPFGEDLAARFHAGHERLYGYADRDRPVEVVNLRLTAVAPGPRIEATPATGRRLPAAVRQQRVLLAGRWRRATVHERTTLRAGARVCGPALLCEFSATTLVPPGWTATVHASGHVEIRRED
jgi:N-methylhydantoinase A